MAIRIVRLGSDRATGEGLRIGTVRRPPRGVPKTEFASQNWYDVWFPNLAPSVRAMKMARPTGVRRDCQWTAFDRKYRSEMAEATPVATWICWRRCRLKRCPVGCYCEDESRCHRSFLRALLANAARTSSTSAD